MCSTLRSSKATVATFLKNINLALSPSSYGWPATPLPWTSWKRSGGFLLCKSSVTSWMAASTGACSRRTCGTKESSQAIRVEHYCCHQLQSKTVDMKRIHVLTDSLEWQLNIMTINSSTLYAIKCCFDNTFKCISFFFLHILDLNEQHSAKERFFDFLYSIVK